MHDSLTSRLVLRYTSGQKLKEIALDEKMPVQDVRTAIYTSPEFADWVLSQPSNTREFVAHYCRVFTGVRAVDMEILRMNNDRYNHLKHALLTLGRIKGTRKGIYNAGQMRVITAHIGALETKKDMTKKFVRQGISAESIGQTIRRAVGSSIREYRRENNLSMPQLSEEVGISKGFIKILIQKELITVPYTHTQIASLLRAGMAMMPTTNRASRKWQNLITDVRNTARYDYVSTRYLFDTLPVTSRGIMYQLRHLTPQLRLHPQQKMLFGYRREEVAHIVGEWLGPKYRWAVRQVDRDWLTLKCDWYTWETK